MPLHIEDHDGIALLRLDRPPVNATDLATLDELTAALEDAASAKAIVLTGEGKIFSAGADLQAVVNADADYIRSSIDGLTRCFRTLFTTPCPVVAAINGHALAGGCVVSCGSDYRVLAARARIGAIEHQAGVPFPAWALELVRFAVNNEHAAEVILFGRAYDASTALDLGIVDEVVEGDVVARALETAQELGAIPARSFSLTKKGLRSATLEAADRLSSQIDEDVKEAWCSEEVLSAVRRQLASLRS